MFQNDLNECIFFVDVSENEAIQLWGEGGHDGGKFSVTGGLLCLSLLLACLYCVSFYVVVVMFFFFFTFFTEPFTS